MPVSNPMLAVHEREVHKTKKVSIRYDSSTRTYYCFYHRTDDLSSELILSYDLNECRWNVDTIEYKNLFETKLNQLFNDKKLPFEEQIRYVIDYLDDHFAVKPQSQKMKINVINPRVDSVPWLRRFRGVRRWASQDILSEKATVLQRYPSRNSATRMDKNEQIMSVKGLAKSFYADEYSRPRTKSITSILQYPNERDQTRLPSKAPPITEVWLNVTTQEMDDLPKKIGSHIEEEKLKKLADKFITYFSGTFQCNVGHQYQLEYDSRIWKFIVHKVEFSTNQTSETTKNPKTKIIFLVNGIPHYVRG